jgi:hypothetical protein
MIMVYFILENMATLKILAVAMARDIISSLDLMLTNLRRVKLLNLG